MTGQKIRVFTLVDVHTRECLTLRAQAAFRGEDVARILSDVGEQRHTLPEVIQVDNGTEFTSNALDHWAYWNRVQLDFSRPAKPVDNCIVEAFNGSLRRECLSLHWFASLQEAQMLLNDWRADYNNVRPHSSLANDTPAEYAKTATGGKLHPEPLATEKLALQLDSVRGGPSSTPKCVTEWTGFGGKTNAGAGSARYGAIRGAHRIMIGAISRGLRYRDTNCDFRPHRNFLCCTP